MDLGLHFPSVYPLTKQGLRRAKSANLFMSELTEYRQIVDAPSPSFGQSLSRKAFHGDTSIWPREKTSSSSMGRSKKGSVCCKKQSDPSKLNQEEIISLFRRIQSSISKGKSPEGLEGRKNRDGTPENVPLSKAILDILEKPRKKTEGDTRVKEPPERQVKKVTRPPSSFAKRSPIRPTSGPRELKEVAKNRGIKGYSKLKKSELLKLIRSS